MNRRSAAALALCLAALAGEAGAQPSPDAAFVEARARFAEAVAAVQAGRPADAVGLFERSYATRAAPVVAVNLAYCLRGLGRFAAAREWYVRFLATATPDDLARHEATVRAQLDEVTRRLAHVTAGDASPPGARLLLDGVPLTAEPRWVDPGEHRVEASAAGHVPSRLTLSVLSGEALHLDAALAPVAAPTPFTRRWWFWSAVGLGLAGVTAAVMVPVLGTDESANPVTSLQLP
ncbi:MAG: hypothetical protein JWM10_5317 [Myxococcaceae bacterium]|nr:hypothetical protein [Myxococcaceae bacterium]